MLPNHPEKYDKEAVFTPRMSLDYRIQQEGKPQVPIPKAVILCVNWSVLQHFLEMYEYEEVEGFFAHCYRLKDEDVLVVSKFGVGAATTVMFCEELIAYGVSSFILIGNAGAISPDVSIGDIVVCEKAIRDEGVSYHYVPASPYADASLAMTDALKEALEHKDIAYHAGTSWTTDAFFRETVDEVKRYQREGVLTVEMEASALFAVASYRDVDICALFSISDNLANLQWEPAWHTSSVDTAHERLCEIALETVRRKTE